MFLQLRRENFYIVDNYNSHLQILFNFSVYVLKIIFKQNLHVGTCQYWHNFSLDFLESKLKLLNFLLQLFLLY